MMEHPIGEMMQSTMASIKDMVDVNTVVGDPVVAATGATIIPVSKVCFGYVTGGGDLPCEEKNKLHPPLESSAFPFVGEAARAFPCSRWVFWWSPARRYACFPRSR